jgi:hypothetical protein
LTEVTCNTKKTETRTTLHKHLDDVLAIADKKYKMEKAPNEDRLSWGRLITSTVQVYGKIINDEDLEAIKQRIDELEKAVKP